MTSMRERVARAICNKRRPVPAEPSMDAWDVLNFWATSEMVKGEPEEVAAIYAEADAAIDAVLTCLETPSPEMVKAGTALRLGIGGAATAVDIFTAMIREAKK